MRFIPRLLHALPVLLAPVLAAAAVPATPAAVEKICADYWEDYLVNNPISATFNGDNRYNDRFGPVTSAEDLAATRALAEKYLARLAALDPASLPSEDRISYDLLRYQLQQSLDGLKFPSHLMPVNQMSSLHLLLAQLGSGRLAQPFDTVADYDRWLARRGVCSLCGRHHRRHARRYRARRRAAKGPRQAHSPAVGKPRHRRPREKCVHGAGAEVSADF
jgi:uncharacterized protein (DUF885 family)